MGYHFNAVHLSPLPLPAADNVSKIFALLRKYEPRGPMVRSQRIGVCQGGEPVGSGQGPPHPIDSTFHFHAR